VKLLSVKFHDYRIYAGQQEISLDTRKPSKPVVLVGGLNGEGKTTLLEGLQLALYGRRSEVWQQNGSSYSEYLAQSIHRGADPSNGAMVQVEFDASDGGESHNYRVQRTWRTNGNGKIVEYVQVFVDGSLDKHLSETWNDQVERFVPARLAGLYFFDGEKIKHYADPQRSRELIERGLLALLGIDLLDQLNVDLRALETRIVRSSKSVKRDAATNELEAELKAREQECDRLFETKASTKNQCDAKRRQCESLDQQFEQDGGKLFEQRQSLEFDRQKIAAGLKSVEAELVALSSGSAPMALVENLLMRCALQMQIEINVMGSRATLSRFESQHERLLEKLAAAKTSRRTRDLIDEFYQEESAQLADIASISAYLEPNEVDLVSVTGLLETVIPEQRGQAARLLEALHEFEAQLQDADRKLAAVPDSEALAEVQQRRNETWYELAVLEGRIEQLAEETRLAGVHRTDAETALQKHRMKLMEQSSEAADLVRTVEHAKRVRDTLAIFKERLIERRIDQLEELILESYVHLMRKNGMIATVSIDRENFELSLFNKKNQHIQPEWLSAGERQLLVVSILWGFARASGLSLPVIVDTPLGRLDSTHRDNLVRHYFPQASHQVILLSTDEEIIGKSLKTLKPAISHQYRLIYDEATDSTRIEPGYFKERAHAN